MASIESSESASPIIFDSLPYFDKDRDENPVLAEQVAHVLAVETQQVSQEAPHPHMAPAFEIFSNNPLLAAEMQRMERKEKLNVINADKNKLALVAPGPDATEEEWKAALDNAHVQVEHQRIRHNNLALLQQYGSNAWRIHNYLLEADTKQEEKLLEQAREQATHVNRDRRAIQDRIGAQLDTLDTRWQGLVSSVVNIETVNAALEMEVHRLNRRETELAGALA
ncbi:uncharacterized protein STEHIDRAFT_144095 [Stereum hirsutum FP-91666 SS1]|uniref:uncharacterized protein n=1 Tax=Stereum hirsutum (strain FP-91666) TaxID=721885 RepID=UPI000440E6DB|nr:uncharacterized protein STEHIDRAFT_144095 [Stereum hirsutum FP-91666 SS1]EIM92812.1 hypothetical protein STEHIDRAFT_144095 [Stereum hirsutum FP-91666 SS1]